MVRAGQGEHPGEDVPARSRTAIREVEQWAKQRTASAGRDSEAQLGMRLEPPLCFRSGWCVIAIDVAAIAPYELTVVRPVRRYPRNGFKG